MKRCLLFLCVFLLLLSGCGKKQTYTDTPVFAMDTAMNLRIYADTDGAAATELSSTLQALEKTLSVTDSESTLSTLNRSGTVQNAELAYLLQTAQELSVRTNGALDVTVYPAVRLWGFTGQTYRVPSAEELAAVRKLIGSDKASVSGETVTLQKGTLLDFGALAKGYAADRCKALLEARGLCGVLSLGGNVQTVGDKPDGSPWSVGIQNPDDPSTYVAAVRVNGSAALVTSGDYQRYFEADGVRYCHIFDPATAAPVQSDLRSVTIVAQSGVLADGLSTALFVMGLERATAFWQSANDFEAVLIDTDGAIYATEGLEHALAECEFTVIRR